LRKCVGPGVKVEAHFAKLSQDKGRERPRIQKFGKNKLDNLGNAVAAHGSKTKKEKWLGGMGRSMKLKGAPQLGSCTANFLRTTLMEAKRCLVRMEL